METGSLDDRYLVWLYDHVANAKTRRGPRTYWDLFEKLYSIEFVWFVPNDDNRAADGRELRTEWATAFGEDVPQEWLSLGCNFLEMLIGLSKRLAFETDGKSEEWFWHLIDNLGLRGFNDRNQFDEAEVEEIVNAVIWRTYDRYGNGGLFPLPNSRKDQRRVEIWYQLSEYLLQGT